MNHFRFSGSKSLKGLQILLLFALLLNLPGIKARSQNYQELNTARDCKYMKPAEKEMIYEINVARNHPEIYLGYLKEYLDNAKESLKDHGNRQKNYSIHTEYETIDGRTKVKTDTIWFSQNEEEVKAIESLIHDLKNLLPLTILKPDAGIYKAATIYAADQERHKWELSHRGSDGSWPYDRIKRYSPKMIDGNENIAGKYPEPLAKEIVIQLLIDSGIRGYGHRYNILNPKWTHVACFIGGLKNGMYRWLQEFGEISHE